MGNTASSSPLGLVAGSGALPLHIAEAARQNGREVFIVALENEADEGVAAFPHAWNELGHMATAADKLVQAGCEELVIIGGIQRPKLEAMSLDEGGEWFMREAASGAHTGDDQLLKIIIAYFQMRGLNVQPAQNYLSALSAKPGRQTRHAHAPHQADIDHAVQVARLIGSVDIGQSVVVANRLVLAVEGPEGTDNMLRRLLDLPSDLRGSDNDKRGVLAKFPKPQQDRRVDLPTIGRRTIEGVCAAHLAGIVYESGGALFDDFDAVAALAEENGLFLLGLEPDAAPPADDGR